MELEIQNNNKSIYIMTCNDPNCVCRLYVRVFVIDTWKDFDEFISVFLLWTCYRENLCQITFRLIVDP
jgi:hypothetical protein